MKNSRRSKWTRGRIARLGFLIGAGLDGHRVAADPGIDTTPGNVYRVAKIWSLSFRAATRMAQGSVVFSKAAALRGISPEQLRERIFAVLESEPTLIDNILDDMGPDVGNVVVETCLSH
jgi:hypothetical protein